MSTENEGLLEVRDLKVHFPLPKKSLFGERSYVKAVDGVSFRVRKGTTFGIVGESGSGKTTLARIIAGVLKPTRGTVLYDGGEPDGRGRAPKQMVQMIFQNPYTSLNPRMTVQSMLEEPLILHTGCTRQERRERVEQMLSYVGLKREDARKYLSLIHI